MSAAIRCPRVLPLCKHVAEAPSLAEALDSLVDHLENEHGVPRSAAIPMASTARRATGPQDQS